MDERDSIVGNVYRKLMEIESRLLPCGLHIIGSPPTAMEVRRHDDVNKGAAPGAYPWLDRDPVLNSFAPLASAMVSTPGVHVSRNAMPSAQHPQVGKDKSLVNSLLADP